MKELIRLNKQFDTYINLTNTLINNIKKYKNEQVIDEFRAILVMKTNLVNKYKMLYEDYNVNEYNQNHKKRLQTQNLDNNRKKQLNAIKQMLEQIEKTYLKLRKSIKVYFKTPLKTEKSKLKSLKNILIGGGIKKIGEYLFKQDEIGSGGYGKIYMGWNEKNDELYIIKKMDRTLVTMNEVLNLKEIRDANGKKCFDNILCYHDHIDDGEHVYLITKFVENVVDLFEFLEKRITQLTILEKLVIMINITKALQVIHNLNIAHSDLKPENILINPDNLEIQLIDFGASCNAKYIDRCSIIGTIDFASPELLEAMANERSNFSNIDIYKKSDIYSLGLLFYLILNNNVLPSDIIVEEDINKRIKELIKEYSRGVKSHSMYPIVDNLINEILVNDYKMRPSLEKIEQELQSILQKIILI